MRRFPLILALLASTVAVAAGGTVADIDAQLGAGHYREALATLAPLLQAQPQSARLLELRGRAEYGLGDYAAAVKTLRRSVRAAPEEGTSHYWLGEALSEHIDRVGVLSRPAMAGELRDEFLRAVERNPQDIPARESLLEFYLQAPTFLGGGRDRARDEAAAIARLDPARGARARARIAAARDDVAAAVTAYREAIAGAPADVDLRRDLGEYFLALGRDGDAYDVFEKALRLAPDDHRLLDRLSQAALRGGGSLEPAAVALRHLILLRPEGVDPSLAQAHLHLGQVYERLGRTEEARDEYRAVLRLDPDNERASALLDAS